MKGPLPGLVWAYASGILVGLGWQPPPGALLGTTIVLLLAAGLIERWRTWFLWPALVLAGWSNLVCRLDVLAPDDLRRQADPEPQIVTLRGRLAETPSLRYQPRNPRSPWRCLAPVELTAWRRGEDWLPVSGTVMTSTPGQLGDAYYQGRLVEITGVLQKPAGPAAEGLFDYQRFLYWQGIYFTCQVDSTNDWQWLQEGITPPAPPLADRFCAWARACLARGLPEEDENLRLIWAMTLGWKTGLNGEIAQQFMRTGTLHIFAISGLHVALITGIFVSVFRVLRFPRSLCGLLMIPLIWGYTAFTGWQSSAIRSAVMMSVIVAGWTLRRPSDLVNSLAGAGLLLLLWDPRQLFQASFQLSFAVVLSLALLVTRLDQWQDHWLQPDPLLPEELRPRWRRWLDQARCFLMANLAVSVASWFGSLPLIAYYFHMVTPVSLVANLVVVPLSSLALACNMGSLICGNWLPALTELFNHSGWLWMRLMVVISESLANVPGGFFYVRAPGALLFALYYACLGLILTKASWGRRAWTWAWTGWLLLAAAWIGQAVRDQTSTKLTLLSLTSGEAVFWDAPGWKNDVLIDTGDAKSAASVVIPFLRGQGVNRLPQCVLTHGDVRHVGGLTNLFPEFKIRRVIVSAANFRSTVYRRLLQEIQARKIELLRVQKGSRMGSWQVLHPGSTDRFGLADDLSMVMKADVGSGSILLCSDLATRGQIALAESGVSLTNTLVVSGMPSKGEPLEDGLLEQLQPQWVIITGRALAKAVQERLRDRLGGKGVRVLFTEETGSITLTIQGHHWSWSATSPHPPNGFPQFPGIKQNVDSADIPKRLAMRDCLLKWPLIRYVLNRSGMWGELSDACRCFSGGCWTHDFKLHHNQVGKLPHIMPSTLTPGEEAQLMQTIEMFEVITQSQPLDYQSLEILKEAYFKLGRQKDVVNTAKRIAQAYVHMGQLSSAILEYESVLQLFPDDPDVKKALGEIEDRANSLSVAPSVAESDFAEKPKMEAPRSASPGTRFLAPKDQDDGRKGMHKAFVEGKHLNETDFDALWPEIDPVATPVKVLLPFLQLVSERGLLSTDKMLKILCERSRLCFIPLEKYDVDVLVVRAIPAEICRRWCVLPFDRMSKSLLVATCNPFNKLAMADIERVTPNRLLWYLASPLEITQVLNKAFR